MTTVDDDQIEQLRRLWDRYGRLLVAALVAAVVGVFGRTLYGEHQERQAVAAAALYAAFQKPAADQTGGQTGTQTADALADQLRTHYPRSSYATFASLMQAKQAVEAGKPELAEQRLRWVIDESPEPADRALARLRLARLLLDQGKAPQAADALQKDVPATAAALELRGDIAHAAGNAQDARQAYQEALAGLPADSGQAAVIKLKLDALGQP